MELMQAAEEMVAEFGPGQKEVRLATRADQIQIVQCEIEGSTVPFNFDSGTGTLDLPENLRGRPVTVTYTTTVSDPGVLNRTYREIKRQEIERQVKDEWNQAWDQSRFDVVPDEEPSGQRLVIGHGGAGPYRSSEIVQYVEPRAPWYTRLWHWLTRWF